MNSKVRTSTPAAQGPAVGQNAGGQDDETTGLRSGAFTNRDLRFVRSIPIDEHQSIQIHQESFAQGLPFHVGVGRNRQAFPLEAGDTFAVTASLPLAEAISRVAIGNPRLVGIDPVGPWVASAGGIAPTIHSEFAVRHVGEPLAEALLAVEHQLATDSDLEGVAGAPKYAALLQQVRDAMAKHMGFSGYSPSESQR